jgi:hypothetical protein
MRRIASHPDVLSISASPIKNQSFFELSIHNLKLLDVITCKESTVNQITCFIPRTVRRRADEMSMEKA